MKIIDQQELDAICKNGKAIDSKGGYPAVVLHPNSTVTKIWARKKQWLSSSRLRPYSARFIRNAAKLKALGILVPEIITHARLKNSHIRIVTYTALSGHSIRELLASSPDQVDMTRLCKYIHSLHEKGIYFGGMHLGNIMLTDNGFGLIDFTDVRYSRQSLKAKQRAANLRVPMRYTKDMDNISLGGLPNLISSYLSVSKLSACENEKIKKWLGHE